MYALPDNTGTLRAPVVTADGFTTLINWENDPAVAQSDAQIKQQVPTMNNAILVGVWTKAIDGGLITYKLRYRTASGTFAEVSVDQAPAAQVPVVNNTAPVVPPVNQTTKETALVNFESNEGVQKVKAYVQLYVPNLKDATIVGVWTSSSAQGLTNYRTRFFNAKGQFVEVNLTYTPDGNIVQQAGNQAILEDNIPLPLSATTPDGYQLLNNYGVSPVFLKVDNYARTQKPELSGSQVTAVWTKDIPNVGVSYRIQYTSTSGSVV